MTHNLLTDPIVGVSGGGGNQELSLPGLLGAMARLEVTGFPAMRPHQGAAWHMFLVQLGALALWNEGLRAVPKEAGEWELLLRNLTAECVNDEPWRLIVDEPSQPAFLQPPRPDNLKWEPVLTPDGLDMLVTSRNWDIKRAIARQNTPEDWLFALVSLQTMEGFMGRGNYGIARMNGGAASRPLLGLAPGSACDMAVSPSAWWRRDVNRLLSEPREPHVGTLDGPALLWSIPWVEGEQLQVGDLDPWFIEACRRVRLVEVSGTLSAVRSNSKKARVDAKAFKGNVGDPWAPVEKDSGKSFTLGAPGFTYRQMCSLLYSGDWEVPVLAKHGPAETGDMVLIAQAFARGQGKTEGWHERRIAVPKPAFFASASAAQAAAAQVDEIAAFDTVLRNALTCAAAGGAMEWDKGHYARSSPARDRFQRQADRLFFDALWARVAAQEEGGVEAAADQRKEFLKALLAAAEAEFRAALPTMPCPSAQRLRAEARAERLFHGSARKRFAELMEKGDVDDDSK